ncbi:MAG: GNVR domain-containing protein [Anaerolineaceae bacterium]|nr:GNVR domain-containing protein [Anaerolineaceae bacterium]
MEIMIFLRLLLKRWWIILAMVLITVAGTWILTNYQIPIYSAAATYIVSPSPEILNGTSFLSGLSVLGGQPTVANTYSSIATSSTVKERSSQALGLSPAQTKSLHVDSRVQNGTSVIEITVEGTDPLLVQAFTNRIGESTIDYVNNLNGVYDLELLDSAKPPEAPIRPNKRLNLVLGIVLGLALGGGLAFLTGLNEY